MDALRLQVLIWMELNRFIIQKQVALPEVLIDPPKLWNDLPIVGSLVLRDFSLTGLDTITNNLQDITVKETEEEETYNVCLSLPIEYLNFSTKYVADVAVGDDIPIYGEGSFSMNLGDILMNLCLLASYKDAYVDNVDLRIWYNHETVDITGIYKNSHLEKVASRSLKIVSLLFDMWNRYEPEKASCAISPLAQYALNSYLAYDNKKLAFNQTCLESSLLGDMIKLGEELIDLIKPIAMV